MTVRFVDRPAMSFDQVVFACNGDRVPRLLEAPTDTEREVLGAFRTSRNESACTPTAACAAAARGAGRVELQPGSIERRAQRRSPTT